MKTLGKILAFPLRMIKAVYGVLALLILIATILVGGIGLVGAVLTVLAYAILGVVVVFLLWALFVVPAHGLDGVIGFLDPEYGEKRKNILKAFGEAVKEAAGNADVSDITIDTTWKRTH